MTRPKTQIIIFSKDRTLQLKSLLLSIQAFTDIEDHEICVSYLETPPISYDHLKSNFSCKFKARQYFLEDMRAIVDDTEAEYVLFMVDDLIVREHFSLRAIEHFLDNHSFVEGFSLRLGLNIEDGIKPEFKQDREGILYWKTQAGLGNIWNYFWDLSCSLYRKKLVKKFLHDCSPEKVDYPNPMEWTYYHLYPSFVGSWKRRLIARLLHPLASKTNWYASFDNTKCFTQGVNKVIDLDDAFQTTYTTEELHEKMLEGYVVDFSQLKEIPLKWPNPGPKHFKLTMEATLMDSLQQSQQ